MNDSLKTLPSRAAVSLAELLITIGPGSQCFCCGSTLHLSDAGVASGAAAALEGCVLECLHCGAEVSASCALRAEPVLHRDRPPRLQVLVAACPW